MYVKRSDSVLSESDCFSITAKQEDSSLDVRDEFTLTTFNAAMIPKEINALQQLGGIAQGVGAAVANTFTYLWRPPIQTKHILNSPASRAGPMAQKLASTDSDILCGQEVFDSKATDILCATLTKTHHVVHQVGKGRVGNSGLFFASRYPIDQEGVRFWSYTNTCTFDDKQVCKGLLRVPVAVPYQSELREVIVYTSHLQAHESGAEAREAQLNSILQVISEDQALNPTNPIFLFGDLNVTDIEPGGIVTGEYGQRSAFFNQFHDLYLMDHDIACNRTASEIRFLPHDLMRKNKFPNEPEGSFYVMASGIFGKGKVEAGCRYDYGLLFDSGRYLLNSNNCYSEIRRFMEPDLTDHLPLTVSVKKDALFLSSELNEKEKNA